MSQTAVKHKPGRVILIGTILIVAVVVAIVSWRRGWLDGEPKYATPALDPAHLPADTAAVINVNLRKLQESQSVSKELGPAIRKLLDQMAPDDLRTALAVDPESDIDWMQLTLHPGNVDHPVELMLLMGGNFNAAKFKLDPKGLHSINRPGDRYRLYELPDERWPRPFVLAPGDHVLLMSDQPGRVAQVLSEQGVGNTPGLEDQNLAEQLQKIDRKQAIWGVASLKKLRQARPLPSFSNTIAEKYLRPIIDNTDVVYGGFSCGNEIDGTVHFQTVGEENALLLEAQLKADCDDAKLFAALAKGLNLQDYLPLLQLLSAGKVTRDGQTVTLHCHLP